MPTKESVNSPFNDYSGRTACLLGQVSEQEVNQLVDFLLRLDALSSEPITIYLACRGGDICEGLKLADTLGLLRSPVTAVAIGWVEGAGFILLVAAPERVLFPSALLSTAGLWQVPLLHNCTRRVGLHPSSDIENSLLKQIEERMVTFVQESKGHIPAFLADAMAPSQLFNAVKSIRIGLADTIINGSDRKLSKPKCLQNHAKRSLTL